MTSRKKVQHRDLWPDLLPELQAAIQQHAKKIPSETDHFRWSDLSNTSPSTAAWYHYKQSIDLWNLLKHWTLDLSHRPASGAGVCPPQATSCARSLVWPILENSCRQLWFIQSSDFPSCACTATGCCALLPFSVYLLLVSTLKLLLLALCNFWIVLHCKCWDKYCTSVHIGREKKKTQQYPKLNTLIY